MQSIPALFTDVSQSGYIKFTLHFRQTSLEFRFLCLINCRLAYLAQVPAGHVTFQSDQLQALNARAVFELLCQLVLIANGFHDRCSLCAASAPSAIRSGSGLFPREAVFSPNRWKAEAPTALLSTPLDITALRRRKWACPRAPRQVEQSG